MSAAAHDRAPLPACTIASNNYLAMARVLAESYREFHPGAEVTVCVVDRPDPAIDYAALPFAVVFAHELPIPTFRSVAFRYDILELNTAVKPFLLAYLRDHRGYDRVLYFDPDILVLDRLRVVEEALERSPIALTPHVTAPLDDRFTPPDRILRVVGVYNLGFVGLRLDDSTRAFLEWWQQKLYRFCLDDLWSGLFVDQSWMDFAPAFLEGAAVLRQPSLNVAYWNLPQRRVEPRGGRWWVEGEPVGFFHFSGIDFADLDALSRHQTRLPRGSTPQVAPLFAAYRERVMAAGHEALKPRSYGYACFTPDGPPVPDLARRELLRLDPYGRRWADPFDTTAADSFWRYLAEPLVVPGGTITRAALCLWHQRPYLVQHYPDPCGLDLPGYAAWLAAGGARREAQLPDAWHAGVAARPAEEIRAALWLAGAKPDWSPPDEVRDFFARIDLSQPGTFLAWLNDPVPGTREPRPVLTRLALWLYHRRPDLQQTFADPLGADQRAFARWFVTHGAAEERLALELVEPVARSLRRFPFRSPPPFARPQGPSPRREPPLPPPVKAPPGAPAEAPRRGRRPAAEAPPGVNLLQRERAYGAPGVLGRGLRQCLDLAPYPVAALDPGDDAWGRLAHGSFLPAEGVPYPLTISLAAVWEMPELTKLLPASAALGLHVGYWLWDLAWLPPELYRAALPLDAVWVPSRSALAAVAPLLEVPVSWVPPAVPVPAAPPLPRESLGAAPGDLLCYAACEPGAQERDNPRGTIEAFGRFAGAAGPGVHLVLHVLGGQRVPAQVAALQELARGLPVTVVGSPRDPEDRHRLLATADVYLSLHHADGVGALAIEAMRLGKPVVATDYGAVTDVLTAETGFPVPWRAVRIENGQGPCPGLAVWAEPEVESAAAQLLTLRADLFAARERAERARRRAEELYAPEAVTRRVVAELAGLGLGLPSPRGDRQAEP